MGLNNLGSYWFLNVCKGRVMPSATMGGRQDGTRALKRGGCSDPIYAALFQGGVSLMAAWYRKRDHA